MLTIRDAKRFTNIPFIAETKGYELIQEPYRSGGRGDFAETFEGGGTFSVVGEGRATTQTREERAIEDINQRESFQNTVFEQIGGNPAFFSEDQALSDFETGAGYQGLFNHVFHGILAWRDRGRMSPEQKQFWNDSVARERAAITEQSRNQKAQMAEQYNFLMGEYDKQAGVISKAREKDFAAMDKKQAATLKKENTRIAAEQKKRLEKLESAKTITQVERNDFIKRTKDYDHAYKTFSKLIKGHKDPQTKEWIEDEWEEVSFSPVEIDALNASARAVHEPEFFPVTRTVYEKGPDGEVLPVDITEYNRHTFPDFTDENLQKIAEAGKDVLDIGQQDIEVGAALRAEFDRRVRHNLTPESISALAGELKGDTGTGIAGGEGIDSLAAEFRTIQASGDQQQKEDFRNKIAALPEEDRIRFEYLFKKKEPEPSGTITAGEKTVTATPVKPGPDGTTASALEVKKTESEKRRAGYQGRQKQRQVRRARSLQQAQ